MLLLIAMLALAYCMGSVSTAILVSRALSLSDPREVGSGNPGATNVLRYAGKKAAAVTLLGDALKGVIPVLVARALDIEPPALTLIGAAAFLGHLYPVFYGFRGGKGVATILGVTLALNLHIGLTFIAVWLLMAAALRYSSLAALSATVAMPISAWFFGERPGAIAIYAAMAALIIWRHRSNIGNLVHGREKRIGQKA